MAERVNILGVDVDAVTMAEAVDVVRRARDTRAGVMVAALVVPDGAGTVWAARHLGHAMPERVAGYDLAQELLRCAPAEGRRVYFFGSAPGVAEKAKAKAEQLYPGIEIVGVRNGFFSPADNAAIIAEIRAARPDLLLVALGVPKQEKWIAAHLAELDVPVAIGVGGTLDVMAGVMKRAPYWMQRAKLEWLFRGLMQPKRAGRLLALPKFVLKVHASRK